MEENEFIIIENEHIENIDTAEEKVESVVDESIETVEVLDIDVVEVGVDSAFSAIGNPNDMSVHNNLENRDALNAHPISSITNLRSELDSLSTDKNPQVLYSDKAGVANYFEWNDGSYDEFGYFVSIVENTSKIKICDGNDILGVTVDAAAFIGNQDKNIKRDNKYGLVVVSGIVDVRCESDIEVGDYVVSNVRGVAQKSESNYGYKVLSKETKNGVEYAVIVLGVQADITNALGVDLIQIKKIVDAHDTNIISAVNVANQAYSKSLEAAESSSVSEEAVQRALETVLGVEKDVEDIEKALESTNSVATQAKAIAESAATSAESMRNEAIDEANKALTETSELRKEFSIVEDGVTEIENQISIIVTENDEQNTAIAGIRTDVTDHDTKINSLVSWQGDTNIAMARIEQKADANGAYIQSTVSNMDKYSVGPHSQAYGFTLEQATSVLEEGMIYVPTSHEDLEAGTPYHTEKYKHSNDNEQVYERTFTPGYLYKWGKIEGQYVWITVDKNYVETDETNTSSAAVYFTASEPTVSGNFGYWYTDGDTITSITGAYEPYTLYKWESYVDENDITQYHWVAVATLAGNSSNRAVSQIRQDANSIELRVTNVEGSAASSKQWIDDNSANIQDVVSWKGTNGESLVTFMQTADENFASASQVAQIVDQNGNIKAASIVTAVNKSGSSVVIDADHVNFEADNYTIHADKINFKGSKFSVSVQNSIDDAVDNIEIGGRNLFKGYGEAEITIGSSSGTESYMAFNNHLTFEPSETVGQTYTISLWAKSPNGPTRFAIYNLNGKPGPRYFYFPYTVLTENLGAEWEYFTYTFVNTDRGESYSDANSNRIEMHGANQSGVLVKKIKVEAGNKATDWTSAPEDVSDLIELKVSKDGVISSINQTSETITIDAKRLNLNGAVTISSLASDVVGKLNNSVTNMIMRYYISDHNAYTQRTMTIEVPVVQGNIDGYHVAFSYELETVAIVGHNSSDNYDLSVSIRNDEIVISGRNEDGPATETILVDVRCEYYRPLNTADDENGWFEDFDEALRRYWELKDGSPNTVYYIWSQDVVQYNNADPYYSTPTVDAATSSISMYCQENGVTKIDGAHIATGTLDASKITTGTFTVKNGDYTLLEAGNNVVKIGDFNVKKLSAATSCITSGKMNYADTNEGVYIGTNGIGLGAGKFYVSKAGVLHAESGDIGGFTIGTSSLYNTKTSYNDSNAGVYVGTDGIGLGANTFYVTSGGEFHAENGDISGWSINADGIFKNNNDTDKTGVGFWSTTAKDNIAIHVGTDSTNPSDAPFIVYHDGTIKAEKGTFGGNIDISINDGSTKIKKYSFSNDGLFLQRKTLLHNTTDSSLQLYCLSTSSYIEGHGGHYIQFSANVAYLTGGTWSISESYITSSDEAKKHDVELIGNEYDDLFDKLIPRRFKYNHGTSDRYHTGFIVQEVSSALSTINLSSKDFAALCESDDGNSGLRYEEFIALNTLQIQKLKARVAELESMVTKLQEA